MGRLTHDTGDGWTYFVTTKAWQNTFLFQVAETAEIIVAKLLEYRERGNYLLHDFVLMPNHLHLILTPGDCTSLEKAMQLIKGGSSFEIHKARGRKLQIWQPGFHESRVTSWMDYRKKKDYVDFNPVAAKLVDRPDLWAYGSACGGYAVDPIPQGLKPIVAGSLNVGPEGPTPGASTEASGMQGLSEAQGEVEGPTPGACTERSIPQGLKPIGSQGGNVGPKGPTPGASTEASGAKAQFIGTFAQGLKPLPPKETARVGPEGPTPVALAKKGGA